MRAPLLELPVEFLWGRGLAPRHLMGNDPINKNLIRESILELLSDEENARVARAEGEVLIEGDEYIDLSDVASGVHQVHAEDTKRPYESVLPRSAVKPETWSRILARIG